MNEDMVVASKKDHGSCELENPDPFNPALGLKSSSPRRSDRKVTRFCESVSHGERVLKSIYIYIYTHI